ncbi:hypothetical protein [Azospirillum thiophilum]|uniref:hypothetical protein n=1 Tax=Azospirillum thiophilum TaxID=528244 RepID=UPI001187588D|nr:hypothetical protein [Azospirillum thiophilum]
MPIAMKQFFLEDNANFVLTSYWSYLYIVLAQRVFTYEGPALSQAAGSFFAMENTRQLQLVVRVIVDRHRSIPARGDARFQLATERVPAQLELLLWGGLIGTAEAIPKR